MKVVAEPIGCHDEKDLQPLPVLLVDAPIPNPNTVRLKLLLGPMNVGDQYGGAIL